MRNLKQNLFSKSFVAAMVLLLTAGLCLAGLGKGGRLLQTTRAQPPASEDGFNTEPATNQVRRLNAAPGQSNTFPRARQCNLGSLQGNYADAASASLIPGGFSPAVCVGVYTFDGRGNFVAKESHSYNGQIIPEANYTGTYTVNANCTGTMTVKSVELGFTSTQNFAITEDNKEIPYIVADDGVVSSGVMKKM
jgi:hypothetical protein